MKRFLLGIVALSMLALPSFSFSSDSVYGIYTDNATFRQNETKRDEAFSIKQLIEEAQSKISKADTTAETTLMNIMKELSTQKMYQELKTQADLIKCDTTLTEAEQNTKIFKLISNYSSQLLLSNYHNPAADKANVYRELAIVKKATEDYSNLNEKILNADSIIESMSNANLQSKAKTEVKKISDILNTRIIDVSDIITQLENFAE